MASKCLLYKIVSSSKVSSGFFSFFWVHCLKFGNFVLFLFSLRKGLSGEGGIVSVDEGTSIMNVRGKVVSKAVCFLWGFFSSSIS